MNVENHMGAPNTVFVLQDNGIIASGLIQAFRQATSREVTEHCLERADMMVAVRIGLGSTHQAKTRWFPEWRLFHNYADALTKQERLQRRLKDDARDNPPRAVKRIPRISEAVIH